MFGSPPETRRVNTLEASPTRKAANKRRLKGNTLVLTVVVGETVVVRVMVVLMLVDGVMLEEIVVEGVKEELVLVEGVMVGVML